MQLNVGACPRLQASSSSSIAIAIAIAIMHQRVTFLQQPADSADPKSFKVDADSISSTKELRAGREDRITFGFDDLPQELYLVLKASHELHIRWISPTHYDTIAPLVARLSPGLHAFYTPQRNRNSSYDCPTVVKFSLLCPALKRVFGEGLDCLSPEKSFTTLPNQRFSLSAATQYHQPLENLNDLVEYTRHKLCRGSEPECVQRVATLLQATSVDFDFDTISRALTITAFWPPQSRGFNIPRTAPNDRLEVGVLSVNRPKDPEELSLGGFLTVVGEDTKPKATLFSFPARHHPFSSTFSASFITPTGMHPSLQLSISSSTPPTEDGACSLHTHLTLPRAIFADKYQLSDPIFLASQNLAVIHHITSPVDLEAPAYAMTIWGSSVLLELAPPPNRADKAWAATIPLHLRYLPPTNSTSGQSKLEVPYPVVFWACVADEGSKFPINPFDKVNIGYDGLFGPKTMFYHVSPEGQRLINTISVPVLDLNQSKYVEVGTAGVVLLGFLWVLWCLFGVWRKNGYGSGKETTIEKKEN